MNRLFHLKETYLNNINNVKSYKDVEFILLDYGSSDEISEWAAENLQSHMDSGLVSFYQTSEPRYWFAAHAKNIAHKLATGDIIFNIDADVSMPEDFCDYIKLQFNRNIIMSFKSEDSFVNHGCAGIIGTKKEHFYSVNGYDESFCLGWGYDDMNYQFRCRMHNKLILFTPPQICTVIPHDNDIRNKYCQLKDIEKTRLISQNLTEDAAINEDYVANKSVDWGSAHLLKNFKNNLAI